MSPINLMRIWSCLVSCSKSDQFFIKLLHLSWVFFFFFGGVAALCFMQPPPTTNSSWQQLLLIINASFHSFTKEKYGCSQSSALWVWVWGQLITIQSLFWFVCLFLVTCEDGETLIDWQLTSVWNIFFHLCCRNYNKTTHIICKMSR